MFIEAQKIFYVGKDNVDRISNIVLHIKLYILAIKV